MNRAIQLQGIYATIQVPPCSSIGRYRPGVTLQTFLIRDPLAVEFAPDFMGTVAIDAGRNTVWFLLPEFSVNHLAVHLPDSPVALLTGGRDIVPMD